MLSYGQSVSRPPWENAGALSIPTEETHTENTALCGRHAARPAARGCHNNVTGRKPAANYTPPRIHGSLSRLVPHSGEFSPASSGGANNKPRRFCAGALLFYCAACVPSAADASLSGAAAPPCMVQVPGMLSFL